MRTDRELRIALLTYRGNPRSGGQGIYVRHLGKALADLGHRVEVFSGPPYPELDPAVRLVRVPSLDLYRPDDPFRRPALSEFRDLVDVSEFALMCGASFPEPLTFTVRAARILAERSHDFDVIHDNQSLGYGLLALRRSLARRGVPVVATVHHPVTIDRRLELEHAADWRRRLAMRRWYGFTRMQARVARRLDRVIAVSHATAADTDRELAVPLERIAVVHNGVDTDLFRPLPHIPRVPGRIMTTASADVPLKGLVHLIEALAKIRAEREADLVVVGPAPGRDVRRAIAHWDLEGYVTFETGVDWLRLVELYAQAEVAVIPSLYEGFSLPAVEAMSCGVPVVATTSGALPEVVGVDGKAGMLVPAADAGALAITIGGLLSDERMRAKLGASGRKRVHRMFTWRQSAAATVAVYEEAMAAC